MNPPYSNEHHTDVVGSLLRPPKLMEARSKFRAGTLSIEAYKIIENQAVNDALRLQEEAGLAIVTDGEMRRDVFFDFFVSGMTGLSHSTGSKVRFHNHDQECAMEVHIPFTVTDKVTARECPGVAEFKYAAAQTAKRIKVTLPNPTMILGFWNEKSQFVYPDPFDLAEDAAEAVAGWMQQLAAAGCDYIQIDAPDLNEMYADKNVRDDHAARGIDPQRYLEVGTSIIEQLGTVHLPNVTKALHVCKGNGTQSWIAEGGYDDFSRHVFNRAKGYDVFHLEYDDDRSGSFEPLKNLPDDKLAILGLVSTKWKKMESVSTLKKRIMDAARFHPLERLGLATQCGFASAAETATQRKMTDKVQMAKLRRVVEAAHLIWG